MQAYINQSTTNRRSLLLKLLLPWLVLILVIAILLNQRLVKSEFSPLENASQNVISEASNLIYTRIGTIKRDLIFLKNSESLKQASAKRDKQSLEKVAEYFSGFSEASGIYSQLRWIDNDGTEIIRVNYSDQLATIVKKENLQSKSDRYYFTEGMTLNNDEFYFSPIDLNVEYDKVEVPYKPVLRSVTPIIDANGNKNGVLILNFLAGELMQKLRELNLNPEIEFYLLNIRGYWLVSPQKNREWGFMFDAPELTMAHYFPESWEKITQKTRGKFVNSNGMWTFNDIVLKDNKRELIHWKLVARVDNKKLNDIYWDSLITTSLIALCFIGLAILACWKIAEKMFQLKQINQTLEQKNVEIAQSKIELEKSLKIQQETQDELVQASKLSSMGMMVAGVAHELNTPIGSALVTLTSLDDDIHQFQRAYSEGLRESDVINYIERFKQGSEIINSNLLRTSELIKSFKRLAVERKNEEKRNFNLLNLVNDLRRALWARNAALSRVLNVNIPADINLNSFPGSLGQIIENIVSNAHIHGLDSKAEGEIEISATVHSKSQFVQITIKDNGKGISEENLPLIFEPFYTTRRAKGGTGLGLHLVYQLIGQVLHGTIKVESMVDVGTRFFIQIPLEG